MKRLLASFLLLLFVFFNSCQKPQENTVVPTPNQSTQSSRYKLYSIVNKKTDLGFALIDSLGTEFAYAFGKKNAGGVLSAISDIVYYSPKNPVVVRVKLSSDNLITEIDLHGQTQHQAVIYDGYDLATGKVNMQLVDRNTNAVLVAKRQITLDANAVAILKRIQENGQTLARGGRRSYAVNLCLTQANMVHLALSYTSCALSLSLTVAEFASGIGAVAGSLNIANTLLSCISAIQDFKDFFNGKCEETGLDDATQTLLSCLTSILTATDFTGKIDCIIDVADTISGLLFPSDPNHQKENPTRGRTPTGGSTGDPHLTTADNLHYDFHGHGEFIFAKSTTDDKFEIQVRQEDLANTSVATLNTAIAVQTGTDVVCITANPDWLYINGKVHDLNFNQLSLQNNAYIVRTVDGSYYTLDIVTSNGDVVRVRFHNSYLLDYILYLKDNRKGKIIGLIGNYDGNTENDLQIRNGRTIANEFSQLYPAYANSWRITQAESLLYYPSGKSTESYTKLDFPKSQPTTSLEATRRAQTLCRNAGIKNEPYFSNCVFDVAVTNNQQFVGASVWAERLVPVEESYSEKFALTDFSKSPTELDVRNNAQLVGPAFEISYSERNPASAIGFTKPFNLLNGFESTYEFSGTSEMFVQVNMIQEKSSTYSPLGIGAKDGKTLIQAGIQATKVLVNKSIPSLFDGKTHKVKVSLRNKATTGIEFLIYVDDMDQPIYHTENTNVLSVYELLTVVNKQSNALRRIQLAAFTNPAKDAKVKIHSWALTPF
ncbi:VWD domain-containing protein [Spirosoma fluminis]